MRLASLLVVVGISGTASAESLGAWTYTPPAGYTAALDAKKHAYTKIDGTQFCMFGVYAPRSLGADLTAEVQKEWDELVAAQFTVGTLVGDPKRTSKQGHHVATLRAPVTDKTGNGYYGKLLVVWNATTIGSVIMLSNTAETIKSCGQSAGTIIDSIVIGASTTPAPPTEAPAQGFVGTWSAGGSARNTSTGMSYGSSLRQYTFRTDGTYRFYSENWRGHHTGGNTYFMHEESGTYTVDGKNVTLVPKKGSGAVRNSDGTVKETVKVPLEKTTYEVGFHYFSGISDNQLVLTPAGGKTTQRDGAFGGNSAFPASYLLSAQYKPGWKFPPK